MVKNAQSLYATLATGIPGMEQSSTPEERREAYNKKRASTDSRKFTNKNNNYVNGTFYGEVPNSVHKIEATVDNPKIDLKIDLMDGRSSTIRIRLVHSLKMQLMNETAHKNVSEHLAGYKKGNAHTHVEGGNKHSKMFAFGERNPGQEYATNKRMEEDWKIMQEFVKIKESILEEEFQDTLNTIRNMEENESNLNLLGKYSRTLDISFNLSNPSHLDRGDQCKGVSMWLSNFPSSDNDSWWFVLPNLSINGSDGVAIHLKHGLCIDWEGSIIRHCTLVPTIRDGEELLGSFLGGKHKFNQNGSASETVIPIV